jgi:deoxycytidylate deaminase
MKTERGFALASNMCDFSEEPQRLGAVIFYKKRPVAVGWNTDKTNPMQKKYSIHRRFDPEIFKCPLHAEMMACINLRKTAYPPEDCTLFVARKYKKGGIALSKPCPACENAIRDLGIKTVYYTISENEYGVLKLK